MDYYPKSQDTLKSHIYKYRIQRTWYWEKQTCRPMEKSWRSSMNTCNFSHLKFDKDAKNINWGKKDIFKYWGWENLMSTYRKIKQSSVYDLKQKQTPNE